MMSWQAMCRTAATGITTDVTNQLQKLGSFSTNQTSAVMLRFACTVRAVQQTILNQVRFAHKVSVKQLEVRAHNLNPAVAAEIYRKHGCVVVRGLNAAYVDEIRRDCHDAFEQSLKLLPQAKHIENIGWVTPDATLFIPASPGHPREKQVMVLGSVDYYSSGALLKAALDKNTLDIVEQIIGPNIELFSKGQVFFKEASPNNKRGANPKLLHQDSAYFQFKHAGVMATLNYTTHTSVARDNGPLYVIPGSHLQGHIPHIDTESHLALPQDQWKFEDAIPIDGEAGDAIFFHVDTVHGSTPNRSDDHRATFINRYLHPHDFQLITAATVHDRKIAEEAAKNDEAAIQRKKEKGFMVRGRRTYAPGFDFQLNFKVHH